MLTTEGKSMLTEKQQPFSLGGTEIQPGQRAVVDIPFGKLYTHTELNIGAHVVHGKRPGPCAVDYFGFAWR